MDRGSGILLHISSLPSPHGIGTLGKAAYDFADFLHAAGQRYWQLLPLGPTSYGDSPYQSFSTIAGNPYFIDLDLLAEEGLLDRSELERIDWGGEPRYVDYGKIYAARFGVLRKAFQRGFPRDREAVAAFQKENPWLESYALYMAVKAHFGMRSWLEWPDEAIRLQKTGVPPESEPGQDFAKAFWDMILDFTGGDLRLLPNLLETGGRPGPDPEWNQQQAAANSYIEQALDVYFTATGYDPLKGDAHELRDTD